MKIKDLTMYAGAFVKDVLYFPRKVGSRKLSSKFVMNKYTIQRTARILNATTKEDRAVIETIKNMKIKNGKEEDRHNFKNTFMDKK